MSKLAEQQADDEVLFGARGPSEQIAKTPEPCGGRPRSLHGADLRERLVDVVECQTWCIRRGHVLRGPDGRAADPDAALPRLTREKADRDLDLLRCETTEQFGQQADLAETATRVRDGRARIDEIIEEHTIWSGYSRTLRQHPNCRRW